MIEKIYNDHFQLKSDINEHLPILKKYGEKCSHITEMGIRKIVSTWAFVFSKPKNLICIDIKHPSYFGATEKFNQLVDECILNNINFKFIQADTLKINIENTDLLFIDTLHNYEQIKIELLKHNKNVNKFIIFHDTVSFGTKNETGHGKGILLAINEFLDENKNWKIIEDLKNNNGLMVLEKTGDINV